MEERKINEKSTLSDESLSKGKSLSRNTQRKSSRQFSLNWHNLYLSRKLLFFLVIFSSRFHSKYMKTKKENLLKQKGLFCFNLMKNVILKFNFYLLRLSFLLSLLFFYVVLTFLCGLFLELSSFSFFNIEKPKLWSTRQFISLLDFVILEGRLGLMGLGKVDSNGLHFSLFLQVYWAFQSFSTVIFLNIWALKFTRAFKFQFELKAFKNKLLHVELKALELSESL